MPSAARIIALALVVFLLATACGGVEPSDVPPAATVDTVEPSDVPPAATVDTVEPSDVPPAATVDTVEPSDVPPAGTVWFGDSFDPSTFAIIGRKTSAAAGDALAMVGNVGRSVDPGDLVLGVGFPSGRTMYEPVSGFGKGEVWAFSLLPPRWAGAWTFELTDVDGNVLATGTIDID